MSLKDLFHKKDADFDPLADLVLSKLKVGYMLDYDLKTWQVTDFCRYDYGDGYITDEWELTSGRDTGCLERAEDDEVIWKFTRKLPICAVEGDVSRQIIENGDPPRKIVCKGKTYYLDESGAGHMHKEGKRTAEFIYWDFLDEDGANIVTIEQWGESDFEASAGLFVEEYQFTNILPPPGLGASILRQTQR